MAETEQTSLSQAPFTKDQLDMLQQLINKANQSSTSTTIGSGGVVQKGNNPPALHVTRPSPTSWIVDSGTSDHMIGDRSLFSSYSPCSNNLTIRIADG